MAKYNEQFNIYAFYDGTLSEEFCDYTIFHN